MPNYTVLTALHAPHSTLHISVYAHRASRGGGHHCPAGGDPAAVAQSGAQTGEAGSLRQQPASASNGLLFVYQYDYKLLPHTVVYQQSVGYQIGAIGGSGGLYTIGGAMALALFNDYGMAGEKIWMCPESPITPRLYVSQADDNGTQSSGDGGQVRKTRRTSSGKRTEATARAGSSRDFTVEVNHHRVERDCPLAFVTPHSID